MMNIQQKNEPAVYGEHFWFYWQLVVGSCANTPKNVNHEKAPEKVPVKIEHRESPATNQVYQVRSSYLIHLR